MGSQEKEVLVLWSKVLKEMERDLKRQKKFEEAKWLSTITKKGVEVGLQLLWDRVQERLSHRRHPHSLSALLRGVHHVVGVSILFLCEGFGLAMKAGARKEV